MFKILVTENILLLPLIFFLLSLFHRTCATYLEILGSPYFCPDGSRFQTRRFQYQEDKYPLIPGLHRQRKRYTIHKCFESCTVTDTCLMAVYNSNSRRCALYHLTTKNLKLLCEVFAPHSDVDDFNDIRKSSEFDCRAGSCRVMEKFCSRCASASLDLLVTLASCDQSFSSVQEVCRATRNALKIPTNSRNRRPQTVNSRASSTNQRSGRRFRFRSTRKHQNNTSSGRDKHSDCCIWAKNGQCHSNPEYMRPNCQKSCGTTGCTRENYSRCRVSVDTSDCD